MSQVTITFKELEDALVDALAWGRAFGPAITRHQWDEMRDQKLTQLIATATRTPESHIHLTHRCEQPERPQALGPHAQVRYFTCQKCGKDWCWNGTGWYKA